VSLFCSPGPALADYPLLRSAISAVAAQAAASEKKSLASSASASSGDGCGDVHSYTAVARRSPEPVHVTTHRRPARTFPPFVLPADVARGVMHAGQTLLMYTLMLAVMYVPCSLGHVRVRARRLTARVGRFRAHTSLRSWRAQALASCYSGGTISMGTGSLRIDSCNPPALLHVAYVFCRSCPRSCIPVYLSNPG
jgi:hypothetical protein